MTTRRELILGMLAAAVSPAREIDGDDTSRAKNQAPTTAPGPRDWMGHETIAMLLYPGYTALDLFGPQHMFGGLMGAKVLLVAETADPVPSQDGVKVVPTTTFAECPERLTILFVPGGADGTLAASESPTVREFVRSRGAKAEWVTSVCTGSVILGAAGLLDGYRATSHWATRPHLAAFGATPVDERVVIDRNRVTGAGVTSGIDFGLTLVEKLRGTEYAQVVQLMAEYDPRPPLHAGSEATAPKEVVAMTRDMFGDYNARVDQIASRVHPAKPRTK